MNTNSGNIMLHRHVQAQWKPIYRSLRTKVTNLKIQDFLIKAKNFFAFEIYSFYLGNYGDLRTSMTPAVSAIVEVKQRRSVIEFIILSSSVLRKAR
jgi:hypothetical protein